MTIKFNNNNASNAIANFLGKNAANVASVKESANQAEFWVNVGYQSNALHDEEGNSLFISLPNGIPLDTMKPSREGSGKSAWGQIAKSKNELLQILLEAAQQLQPGEGTIIPLQIQLYRRAAADKVEATDEVKTELDNIRNSILNK